MSPICSLPMMSAPTRRSARRMALAAALALAPWGAQAVNFVVDTTADTVAADGLTSLREAVAAASANVTADTIVLTAGLTYTLNQCASPPLVVSGPAALTITGNGATLAQSCADTRILEKAAPNTTTLSLQNLVLVPGPNSGVNVDGAAVKATSQLVLDGVTVNGANAGFGGSLIEIDFGPASFDLVVSNSSFTNSTGSALSNLNPAGMQVSNTTVSGNTGSGISLGDGSPLEITDSIISNQGGIGVSTTGQGFGLQPVVTISGTQITGNGGGGFYCGSSCRTLTVTNSTVSNNGATAAPGRGGGLVMPIVLDGGENPSVSITNSTVSGNTADHPGGGLWVAMSFASSSAVQPEVQISASTISNNHSTCAGCAGGGVAVGVGNLLITGSTLSGNNAAGDGGGVAIGRSAGADIPVNAVFTLTESIVSGNTAGGQGGGLSVQVDQALVQDTWIHGNTAATDGGGISAGGVFLPTRVTSGDMQVRSSTLSGNSAQRGGAVKLSFPDGSRVQMLNSTVDANAASVVGGGFIVGPTERLDLDLSTVTRNSAPSSANLATNGPTHIARSVLAQPIGPTNCGLIVPAAPVLTVPHLVSDGHNWFSDNSCAPGALDVVSPAGDPQLGELVDNGGPTPTRLPADASPVVGRVPLANCTTPTDQRGLPRPGGGACEAGAVEIVGMVVVPSVPAMLTEKGDLLIGGHGHGGGRAEAVTVVVSGSVAVITYDADRADPGNALATASFSGPFRDIRVRLRGGSDRFELRGATVGRDLAIQLGEGHDEALIVDVRVHRRLSVEGRSGNDGLTLQNTRADDVDIDLGAGNDRLTWAAGRVDGRSQFDAGPGNDEIRLVDLVLNRRFTGQGGAGNDLLRTVRLQAGEFHYIAGPGNDTVHLSDSRFRGRAFFIGGGGSDHYTADGASSFMPPAVVLGFD